jgi:CheY-like chemotaxis protein
MPSTSYWTRERTQLLGQEHKIRFAVAVFTAAALWLHLQPLTRPSAALGGLALMCVVAVVMRFGITRRRLEAPRSFELGAVVIGVVDLVAITLLVRGTGDLGSSLFALYLLSLIFAAAFFTGLEVALLTCLACMLYAAVCWPGLLDTAAIGSLGVRLASMVFVTWYSYALSLVLHIGKRGNDEILRNMAEGVMVVDASNRVLLINPTFRAMFGIPANQLEGLTPAEVQQLGELMAWIVADATPENMSLQRCTRNGQFPEADLPLLEVTTIACQEEGVHGGWVIVCRDCRDRLLAPEQGEDFCERVSPLANLRALSQALYGLAGRLDTSERWHAVSMIEELTVAIRRLLSSLLDEEKHGGQAEIMPFAVNVPGLLISARRMLELQDKPLAVPMEIDVDESLPALRADRSTVTGLVLELARSLADLAEPDDRLVLSAKAEEDVVVLSFELVMAAPDPLHLPVLPLFDSERIESHLRGAMQAFTPMLVEYEGHWTVRRQPGLRCRVSVALPSGPILVKNKSQRWANFAQWETEMSADKSAEAGAKVEAILVVDDDEGVRSVLCQMLRCQNLTVQAVADGASAVDYLAHSAPPMAFIDLMMPGINGAQVLKSAREQQPDMPVVIMSGLTREATIELLKDQHPERILSKPFGIPEVIAVTSELMFAGAAAGN